MGFWLATNQQAGGKGLEESESEGTKNYSGENMPQKLIVDKNKLL